MPSVCCLCVLSVSPFGAPLHIQPQQQQQPKVNVVTTTRELSPLDPIAPPVQSRWSLWEKCCLPLALSIEPRLGVEIVVVEMLSFFFNIGRRAALAHTLISKTNILSKWCFTGTHLKWADITYRTGNQALVRELFNKSDLGVKLAVALEKCHFDRPPADREKRNWTRYSHSTKTRFPRANSFNFFHHFHYTHTHKIAALTPVPSDMDWRRGNFHTWSRRRGIRVTWSLI